MKLITSKRDEHSKLVAQNCVLRVKMDSYLKANKE